MSKFSVLGFGSTLSYISRGVFFLSHSFFFFFPPPPFIFGEERGGVVDRGRKEGFVFLLSFLPLWFVCARWS